MGFIGIGTINSAVIRGLLTSTNPPKNVMLSPRNASNAAALKKEYPDAITIASSNREVVESCEWIIVATPPKPGISKAVLEPLDFRKEQTILSFIAGIRPETLAELCGDVAAIVQAFPLPPAEHHKSTTVMWPKHKDIEYMFGLLGKVVPVNDFDAAIKVGVVSCVMGDFYRHQCAVYEWLCEQGISKDVATASVGAFFDTFNFASMKAPEEGRRGFAHLVKEQTPGGINEQVLLELTAAGNYANMKKAMTNAHRRLTKK